MRREKNIPELRPESPFNIASAPALEDELKAAIKGEVRFDNGSRALYATDASNYRQVPIGVVLPRDAEDIVRTVEIAREFHAPILGRGGGTSLAGQCCNAAIVLDASKYMNRIFKIDPDKRIARVEPGVVLDDLRTAAKRFGLTFAPDPATHTHCTFGGMIGNNSCGVHSLQHGRTSENIEELEILTYRGLHLRVGATSEFELEQIIRHGGDRADIYSALKHLAHEYAPLIQSRFPQIPRRVSGFGLDQLLPEKGFHVARAITGTESTCALTLSATIKLVPDPEFRTLVVLGYEDIFTACDQIPNILLHEPIALEGIDLILVDDMKAKGLHPADLRLLPEGGGWLLVEFGGATEKEADDRAKGLIADVEKRGNKPSTKLFDDPKEEKIVWSIRESGLGATAHVPGRDDTWEGWEDSAVAPARVGDYLRDFKKLLDRYRYRGALYGHLGQGCLHTRINFDLKSREGILKFRSFIESAADLVVTYGGSFSGEHGDGQSRAELLPKMFGPELVRAFREFKAIWDPDFKMNPGKVVDPYRLDENLRFGADYGPLPVDTHFTYVHDRNSFANAMERCVGVGECRKEHAGTMCPSYMVTREEMHSTRGRARLLFEMLQGNPLTEGWNDPHVHEALDLCLACKACKSECPVNVDMAAYKAEFLAHYYESHPRPPAAYTMGWIHRWARLAGVAPRLANFFSQTRPFSGWGKQLIGIAPSRRIPAFAARPFRKTWRAHANGRPSVLLWPDTFNNYFHPNVCESAAAVLEKVGFAVRLPQTDSCCGRPLYDFGFLVEAKERLEEVMRVLADEIEHGVPIVVLEPSCASVFRDELLKFFPDRAEARRLSDNTFLLAEFLEKFAPDAPLRHIPQRAIVHGHCHQKSIQKMDAEESLLSRVGLDFEILDSGCCGMAGAFGFEKEHYDVSIAAGERVLLPRVRSAAEDTLVIADGFSCREQIKQMTGREAMHLAQVLARL